MELALCSRLLLELGVTGCTTRWVSAEPPAADVLGLLRQSIPRSPVLCASSWVSCLGGGCLLTR